jgi:hypothetical protein
MLVLAQLHRVPLALAWDPWALLGKAQLLDDPPRSRRALPAILPMFVSEYANVTRKSGKTNLLPNCRLAPQSLVVIFLRLGSRNFDNLPI